MRVLSLLLAVVVGCLGLTGCDPGVQAPTFSGFPNPAKVGTPPGWTPTQYIGGDLNITTPGGSWRDLEVYGSINVMAEDVYMERVRVHGRIWNQHSVGGQLRQFNMTVVNSTIGDPSFDLARTADGTVGPGRYKIFRSELYGLDGFRVSKPQNGASNDVVIQDNYFQATQSACSDGFHLDGVQGYFGGQNVTVSHNTLDVRAPCGVNAGVFFADNSESAVVTDNLIISNGFTLRIHDDHTPDVGPWIIARNLISNNGWGPSLTTNTECGNPRTMLWAGNALVAVNGNYDVVGLGSEVFC
jgi:hypothetical protein